MLPALESGEETLVGGQAVMEGVMMRAPHSYCVAVRRANGQIATQEMLLARMSEQYPVYRWPVFRGVGILYQALKLGIKALRFSANIALEDQAPEQAKGQTSEQAKEPPKWAMAASMLFPLAFFIFLYKFVPLFVVTKLERFYPELANRLLFNTADGVLRILIFLGFLLLVSSWKDMRRVWEYHGAEHKVVFNFESGQPVTVENAQRFTTFHPRCGTSFLLVVMVVSMIVYALVPVDGFAAKFAARIVLLPVIAGLSYELIRFASKRQGSVLALLTAPGLWLQRITTKPPADDQTVVAIRALEGAMALEEKQGGQLVIA
ncbi:MAG: DUF1385 domain-containing protein [Acidobacteriia bacterium]|nr:DUF1385 domain-containing protein [Terriglobia bacterium]